MTIDCELTEDDFLARFKPGPNHIDPDAGFDGSLFETFDDDLAYVQSQDPNLVWTVLDCDGQLAIASRFHFVNRLGYLIASVPVAPDHTYSVACEDLTEPMTIRAARERVVSPPLKYRRLCSSVVPVAQAGPPRRIPPAGLRNKTVGNSLDRLTDYRQTRELRG